MVKCACHSARTDCRELEQKLESREMANIYMKFPAFTSPRTRPHKSMKFLWKFLLMWEHTRTRTIPIRCLLLFRWCCVIFVLYIDIYIVRICSVQKWVQHSTVGHAIPFYGTIGHFCLACLVEFHFPQICEYMYGIQHKMPWCGHLNDGRWHHFIIWPCELHCVRHTINAYRLNWICCNFSSWNRMFVIHPTRS